MPEPHAGGDAVTGATVHEVTADYDEGPIVAQVTVPVEQSDSVQTLGHKVRAAERELLIATVAARSTGS